MNTSKKENKFDAAFNSLTENAIEFLEKSIEDFEKSPKFSIINFCAALEMLLKAKLLNEHWTLTLSKIETADKIKFFKGDFSSVTLDQSFQRLKSICDINIPENTVRIFKEIANHRNKLIHFYHDDLKENSSIKTQIIIEQSRALFHLQKLLKEWSEFENYQKQIQSAEKKLIKHNHYLKAKFEELKPEINNLLSRGDLIKKCHSCKCKSSLIKRINNYIYKSNCFVCNETDFFIRIQCPQCLKPTDINHNKICSLCKVKLDTHEILNEFYSDSESYMDAKDGIYNRVGNCDFCDGYHTVVKVDGHSLCCECFEINDNFEMCEWCNEPTNTSTEGSYAFGCTMCGGLSGHRGDD